MPSRRNFILGTAAILATPYIVRSSATAASPILRRDVMDMAANDQFFSDYGKAIQKMHTLNGDNRSWLAQAKIHADYCHHGEVEFLHWHRHYIRFFEKICASFSGNPDFALPYWNWSKNSGRLPIPFFDRPELNVEHWNDPGKYVGKAWGPIDTIGRRGLDKTHGLLDDPVRGGNFTLAKINGIKQLPTIDLFHPALEGSPHNNAHVITGATKTGKGGHIGSGLSPLDPIFWLHHCMVDRVWAEWQRSRHVTPDPGTDYSGQFFEADGTPAKATSTGAMDIATLNYTYDIFQTTQATLAGTRLQSQLSTDQFNELSKVLQAGAPQTIGSAVNTNSSRANLATTIDISVPTLQSHATELRTMEASGLTLGSRRILAKLSGVVQPENNDLVVNVFVNCPYLSPTTPASDNHYAGTFSFFGMPKKMSGMDAMNSPTYVIDITGPVREAGFEVDKVKLQFMPVPASAGAGSKSSFQVGKVEILSV
jgi:tyrosinase